MTVGHKITAWRNSKRFTQVELASRLRVRQGAVANWENGRNDVSRETLARIAAECGVSDAELAEATRLPQRSEAEAA